jgi:hypothetical protein
MVPLPPAPAHYLSNVIRHDENACDGNDPPVEQRLDQFASREDDGQDRGKQQQVRPTKGFQGRSAVRAVQASLVGRSHARTRLKRRSRR